MIGYAHRDFPLGQGKQPEGMWEDMEHFGGWSKLYGFILVAIYCAAAVYYVIYSFKKGRTEDLNEDRLVSSVCVSSHNAVSL